MKKISYLILFLLLTYITFYGQNVRYGIISSTLDSTNKNSIIVLTKSDYDTIQKNKISFFAQKNKVGHGHLIFNDSLYPTAMSSGYIDSNRIREIAVGYGEAGKVFLFANGDTTVTEIANSSNNKNIGVILSNIEDLNEDGLGDFLIGGKSRDTIYLYKGNNSLNTYVTRLYIGNNIKELNSPIQIIGKVNNDYKIAIGYPSFSTPDLQECGKVTIFKYLKDRDTLTLDTTIYGNEEYAHFGSKLSSACIDTNIIPDLIVTAPSAGLHNEGKAYTYTDCNFTVPSDSLLGKHPDAHFGSKVLAVDFFKYGVGGILVSSVRESKTDSLFNGYLYWYNKTNIYGDTFGSISYGSIKDSIFTGFAGSYLSWSVNLMTKTYISDSSGFVVTIPYAQGDSLINKLIIVPLFHTPYIVHDSEYKFDTIICDRNDTIKIYNHGLDTLHLDSLLIVGQDSSNFQATIIQNKQKVSLFDSTGIEIKSYAKSHGQKEATLTIFSNAGNKKQSFTTIPVSAFTEKVDFEFVSPQTNDTLDFGTVCPGGLRDTSFTLKNFSTIKTSFQGSIDSTFSIEIDSLLNILSDSSRLVHCTVKGIGTTDTIIISTLTVWDTCGKAKFIYLKAAVEHTPLSYNLPTDTLICPGNTVIGDTIQRSVLIKNNGKQIHSFSINHSNSKFIVDTLKKQILGKDSLNVIVYFPNNFGEGTFKDSLKFFDECNNEFSGTITVNVEKPKYDIISNMNKDTILCQSNTMDWKIKIKNLKKYCHKFKLLPLTNLFLLDTNEYSIQSDSTQAMDIHFKGIAADTAIVIDYRIVGECLDTTVYSDTLKIEKPNFQYHTLRKIQSQICYNKSDTIALTLKNNGQNPQYISYEVKGDKFFLPDSSKKKIISVRKGVQDTILVVFQGISQDTVLNVEVEFTDNCSKTWTYKDSVSVESPLNNIKIFSTLDDSLRCLGESVSWAVKFVNVGRNHHNINVKIDADTLFQIISKETTLLINPSDTTFIALHFIGSFKEDTCYIIKYRIQDQCADSIFFVDSIKVGKPKIDVSITDSKVICPNSNDSLIITLKNNGKFREKVKIKNTSSLYFLKDSLLNIDSGNTESIPIIFNGNSSDGIYSTIISINLRCDSIINITRAIAVETPKISMKKSKFDSLVCPNKIYMIFDTIINSGKNQRTLRLIKSVNLLIPDSSIVFDKDTVALPISFESDSEGVYRISYMFIDTCGNEYGDSSIIKVEAVKYCNTIVYDSVVCPNSNHPIKLVFNNEEKNNRFFTVKVQADFGDVKPSDSSFVASSEMQDTLVFNYLAPDADSVANIVFHFIDKDSCNIKQDSIRIYIEKTKLSAVYEDTVKLCPNEQPTWLLNLKNISRFSHDFNIKVKYLDLFFDTTAKWLQPDSSKEFSYKFPEFNYDSTFNFNFQIIDECKNVIKEDSVNVIVEKPLLTILCPDTTFCINTPSSFPITFDNGGLIPRKVKIKCDNPIFQLTQNEFEVTPDSSKTVNVLFKGSDKEEVIVFQANVHSDCNYDSTITSQINIENSKVSIKVLEVDPQCFNSQDPVHLKVYNYNKISQTIRFYSPDTISFLPSKEIYVKNNSDTTITLNLKRYKSNGYKIQIETSFCNSIIDTIIYFPIEQLCVSFGKFRLDTAYIIGDTIEVPIKIRSTNLLKFISESKYVDIPFKYDYSSFLPLEDSYSNCCKNDTIILNNSIDSLDRKSFVYRLETCVCDSPTSIFLIKFKTFKGKNYHPCISIDLPYRDSCLIAIKDSSELCINTVLPSPPIDFISIYPNPINNCLNICYHVNQKTKVRIRLIDLEGKIVEEIAYKDEVPGNFSCVYYYTNKIAIGVYYISLFTDPQGFKEFRKIVYVR